MKTTVFRLSLFGIIRLTGLIGLFGLVGFCNNGHDAQ
jgi:hypothetical protein